MSKVFEYILIHPIQSVFVLVMGVSITYTVVRLLKGFFGLFTRKRKARKELARQEKQAEIVLEKLGGIEAFSELVAEKVIMKQKANIDAIQQDLQVLQVADRCPIELRAYIETVLQTSPHLLLQYEEYKAKLVGKQNIQTKIQSKEELEQQEEVRNVAVVLEKKEEQKEEISYV